MTLSTPRIVDEEVAAGGRKQNCRRFLETCFPEWDEICDACHKFQPDLRLVTKVKKEVR